MLQAPPNLTNPEQVTNSETRHLANLMELRERVLRRLQMGPPLNLSVAFVNSYSKTTTKIGFTPLISVKYVPKCGKAGQADTSECSQEPDTRGTEGLASAWRLRPHGMPMPYFGWTRLGGTHEKQD